VDARGPDQGARKRHADPINENEREESELAMAAERKRQIEFPPLQTHVKSFEVAMIVISIICVIVVLVIVLGTNLGNEFRPTV
jgi:hypothetical protein